MEFNLKFENIFKITTTCWRLTRCHPSIVRNTFWKYQVFCYTIMIFFCFNLLLYSVYLNIVEARLNDAARSGTMFIVSFTVSMKYFILIYRQPFIKGFINTIDEDYELAKDYSAEDKNTVRSYAKKGSRVGILGLIASFGTSVTFPVKAFVLMTYYYWQGQFKYVPMFEASYLKVIEENKEILPVFCLLFMLHIIFASFAVTMYVGFNSLGPILMLHTCGQLDLLSYKMLNLFDKTDDPSAIEEELKQIIKKLQLLYRFIDQVETSFTLVFEFILKITTVVVPLCAFQSMESLRNNNINVEFISFFVASVLHFFMPCYYGDLLIERSEYFRQAVYSSGWERCPDKRVRRTILLVLTRTRIPIGLHTVFYTLSLDTFAETCRQSYAIFNLMNVAWT